MSIKNKYFIYMDTRIWKKLVKQMETIRKCEYIMTFFTVTKIATFVIRNKWFVLYACLVFECGKYILHAVAQFFRHSKNTSSTYSSLLKLFTHVIVKKWSTKSKKALTKFTKDLVTEISYCNRTSCNENNNEFIFFVKCFKAKSWKY